MCDVAHEVMRMLVIESHKVSYRHAGFTWVLFFRLFGTAGEKERDITGRDRDNKRR